jgi:hypothetical protein
MKNMGTIDRTIRTILGIGLIVVAVILQIQIGRFWWLGIPGVVFLLTSAVSTCPLYLPFGISTRRKAK